MKPFFKFLYYFCIAYIVLITLTAGIIRISPLEFANKDYEELFDTLFFGGIPVAILLTACRIGFRIMDRTQKRNAIISSFLLSLGCFFLFFFYSLNNIAEAMCDYSGDELLFKNKSNPSSTIISRYYGCGATDSSPSTPSIEIKIHYTPVLCTYTKVDTTRIDRNEWIRVSGR